MDKIVFGRYSLQDLLVGAGFALGVVILLVVLRQIFRKKEGDVHIQSVQCWSCGWQGRVSRYAGRCPKCNTRLGDQKAQS
jgi:predicted Zn-ribbon and HTH transcriptional regulator